MKKPQDNKRSGEWRTTRKKFLKGKSCAVCSGTTKLEAHHIKPFHLFPIDENNMTNLIALCEGSKDVNCHLWFGHLGNWKSYNINVVADATAWKAKIAARP